MPWKKGKIKLADGSVYKADLLIERDSEVWNVKIHSQNGIVEEIKADSFASRLEKEPDEVYPFTYELEK